VPVAAIDFKGRQATLQLVTKSSLGDDDVETKSSSRIIKSDIAPIETIRTSVKLGLVGDFYAEVISGLSEGDMIAVVSTQAATPAQINNRFIQGGAPGGNRTPSTGGRQNN
jgi:hypothetical protein